MTRRLGVLGGTFDPVHFGHLEAADAARSALALTDVLFVPSYDPPHRPDPRASAFHRFALVALALDGRPGCRLSDLELMRHGSSYTSETLRSLHRVGWAPLQIFFILGADAFAEIATWHEFPEVLDAAHFVVVTRPGSPIEESLARTPGVRDRAASGTAVADVTATRVFVVEARTRDVSSTGIRARVAQGRPIDDLVPAAVARHIAMNGLYRMESELHDDKEASGA